MSLSDAQVAEKTQRFEAAAMSVPDVLDPPATAQAGAGVPSASAGGVGSAQLLASVQYFPPPIIGRAMDVLAQIASGLEGAEVTLDKDERECLIEAWEKPLNRKAAALLGESENGDLWGAVIVTGLVFGAKTKVVRETIASLQQMITGMFGSTTAASSVNLAPASPIAPPKLQ